MTDPAQLPTHAQRIQRQQSITRLADQITELAAHLDAGESHIKRARRCAGGSRRRAPGSMATERVGVMVGDPHDDME